MRTQEQYHQILEKIEDRYRHLGKEILLDQCLAPVRSIRIYMRGKTIIICEMDIDFPLTFLSDKYYHDLITIRTLFPLTPEQTTIDYIRANFIPQPIDYLRDRWL
jgi:hypothetical protein